MAGCYPIFPRLSGIGVTRHGENCRPCPARRTSEAQFAGGRIAIESAARTDGYPQPSSSRWLEKSRNDHTLEETEYRACSKRSVKQANFTPYACLAALVMMRLGRM